MFRTVGFGTLSGLCCLSLLSHIAASSNPPPTTVPTPYMSSSEISLLTSYLSSSSSTVAVLEYGCGGSTLHFSSLPTVSTWLCIDHQKPWAVSIAEHMEEAEKASKTNWGVYFSPPDMSSWVGGSPITYEEGTLSEFSEYVAMLPSNFDQDFNFRGGRVDVIVDGRARVDAALRVLPLLLKHDGYLYVHDWPIGDGSEYDVRQCYRTLLQWFTVVDQVDILRVLKPRQDIAEVLAKENYDWCFAWHAGSKLIEIKDGPIGSGAMEELLKVQLNCNEEEDRICHGPLLDKKYFLEGGCVPCKVILESAAGRGDLLIKAREVTKGGRESGGEL